MSIEGTGKNLPHARASYAGQDTGSSSTWEGVKGWGRRNPRLSLDNLGDCSAWRCWRWWSGRSIPSPQTNNRFNQGAQPVGVATAVSGPINVTLNALGTVTPLATATVRPQVGGMLTKLYFTEGQMVKAGDLLAQIDPRPYQAALDQAKGQLARDQANLANAKVDLSPLSGAGGAERHLRAGCWRPRHALVRSDAGIVESDQANVETAEINLGYTRIISPVDWPRRPASGGCRQYRARPDQTTGVVVVTELSPMSVVFTVPEDNISQIMARTGQGASAGSRCLGPQPDRQDRQRQARHHRQ